MCRRAPAVLLLIKLLHYLILSEWGLHGATAQRAENVSSWLIGSTSTPAALALNGCKDQHPLTAAKEGAQGVWD